MRPFNINEVDTTLLRQQLDHLLTLLVNDSDTHYTPEEKEKHNSYIEGLINMCDCILDTLEVLETDRPPSFPNGFTDWHETHYQVVEMIHMEMDKPDDALPPLLHRIQMDEGRGGLWELACQITNAFENKYQGITWGDDDMDYSDTLLSFFSDYVAQVQSPDK